MTKVAIVTVNFNGESDTLELLESIKRLTINDIRLMIIVVDNGSKDNLVKKASQKYPDIDVLQNGQNLGFSGGFNRGIEHALIWGADYVLMLNNDTLIKDLNILEELIKTADSDPKIGLVAPKIYFAKGFEYHKDRYKDQDLGNVIWYAGGKFNWDHLHSDQRGINEVDEGKYDLIEEVDFAQGACLLIKKEVFDKVGLFDERYFAYFEDNDFSVRVKNAGFKKYYNGAVGIYHKVSRTTGIGSPLTDYYHTRNRLYFAFKYAKPRTRFAVLRQSLGFLLTGRPAQKEGVLDFLKGKSGPWKPQDWNDKADYQTNLSIVSVNYNTPDLIENLLKSIYQPPAISPQPDHEVIILDNGSEEGCADVIKKYEGVHFIQNPENMGFTGGYNKAMKYARGKYILMLNSDIEVKEDSLKQITKEAEDYKDDAIVSGALYFPDGTLQDSCFFLPTIFGALKEYFLGVKGAYFMFAPTQEKNTQVEGAAMASFLIPRKILNKVGFLNEKLFTYFEDVDYCRRLKKLGTPIYYTPKAKFLHHHGATGKRMKAGQAYELLQRAAKIYFGEPYYSILSLVLRISQKLSWVKTPVAR